MPFRDDTIVINIVSSKGPGSGGLRVFRKSLVLPLMTARLWMDYIRQHPTFSSKIFFPSGLPAILLSSGSMLDKICGLDGSTTLTYGGQLAFPQNHRTLVLR